MLAGATVTSEILTEEGLDVRCDRRHVGSSADEGFTGAGDVAQQVGRSLEIPVGCVDVDVTQVGRQGDHVLADASPARRAGLKRPHRECMPEIVQTRMATAWRWSNTCRPQQLIERRLTVDTGGMAMVADEHMVVI